MSAAAVDAPGPGSRPTRHSVLGQGPGRSAEPGLRDILICCCDGSIRLRGCDPVGVPQRCGPDVHRARRSNVPRFVSYNDCRKVATAMSAIYTGPTRSCRGEGGRGPDRLGSSTRL